MWYKAWREILQGVLLDMSLVERCGGEARLGVGISSCSSSGSTMGIAYVVGLVRAVGLMGASVGLGHFFHVREGLTTQPQLSHHAPAN